ncbi:hypothetical protein MKX03_033956 [Papaver bracteatum]|nr:hypothetical protein MKX03_033956 [Papaver bracteatum]
MCGVDPNNSLSHPEGVYVVQVESATCLDPDHFANCLVKTWAKLLNDFYTEIWSLN